MVVLMLAACGVSPVQDRINQLEAERADLARQNQQLMADLDTCKARCKALERQLGEKPPPKEAPDLPEGIGFGRNIYGQPVISIPADVVFPSGVSTLSSRGKKALGEIANTIKREYPGAEMRVEGHTDTDPIKKTRKKYHSNWDLSFERAHSVLKYLVDVKKFDPRKMACVAYGEYRPRDPGNKAKNRRVEIVILQ
jgi:chemotaxis protein MotB